MLPSTLIYANVRLVASTYVHCQYLSEVKGDFFARMILCAEEERGIIRLVEFLMSAVGMGRENENDIK